ncbi:hypothetical protein [Sphingobium fuliginis]|jgi:hypothetical protein|uniref:hypothetical protein n=1 Tax=Sphingobium fuliginis (strain ATCC 27551) TaxID=336203 RepID=UPI0037CB90C1
MTAANPLRGEKVVSVGGVDYKLVLDVNAFCYAQAELGKKSLEITAAISGDPDDMLSIRGLFWASLQKYHPCHLFEAGEIMADAGPAAVRAALLDCLADAFGLAESQPGATEDKEGENPQRTLGTGSDSTGSTAKPEAAAKGSGKKRRD